MCFVFKVYLWLAISSCAPHSLFLSFFVFSFAFFPYATTLMEASFSQTPRKIRIINLNFLDRVYHSLPNHFVYFFFSSILNHFLPCPPSFWEQHFFPKCTFCLLWFLLWLVIRGFPADGGGLWVLVVQPSPSFLHRSSVLVAWHNVKGVVAVKCTRRHCGSWVVV